MVKLCGFCGREMEIKAKGLCGACYSRYIKRGSPEYVKVKKKCTIAGCNNFRVSHGLCDKHRQRQRKHNHTKLTRERGWGSKETHPLYHTWWWQKRREPKVVLSEPWQDFWTFVKDVGDRPSPRHRFFVIDSSKPVDKHNFEWRECVAGGSTRQKRTEYCRKWRKNNPERVKDHYLKKQFGIGLDQYHTLLESQGYVCAICGEKEIAINSNSGVAFGLAVDHCHTSGKVRGLLCKQCNNAVGFFKDSKEILTKAINYLQQHEE